jgi:hypothetical protein
MAGHASEEFHVAIIGRLPELVYDAVLMSRPGAGIAGLALAIALHNRDVSFTLYDGAKEISTVG